MMRFVFSVILVFCLPSSAFALTAYKIAPQCFIEGNDDFLALGECFGTLQALFDLQGMTKYKLCIPVGVTIGQAGLIIKKYAMEHPEKLHFPFTLFALIALQETFPCGRGSE